MADFRARRVAGLNVLRVSGTPYEMGRQHGELLKHQIPSGPIPYYRSYIQKLVGRGFGPAAPLIPSAINRTIGRQVARAMPDYALESVRGLADGSGLPYESLLSGCTMPDSLLWVAATMMRVKRPGPAVAHRLAMGIGCTSAVAWGEATTDGKLLHARNFDYHGVGCWPDTASVVFHAPTEGHRYVSVAAAGVVMGGVTAMNEAGLSLTVHQHMFTDRTALGGTPIGAVGDRIMREASTLGEAQAILRQHRPIGCWTYLITCGRTREVLCWEENPERQVPIRPQGPTFGYTNIYLDRELGQTEVNLYGSYWRHNRGRYERVTGRLAEGHGRLDPQGMADILGDTGSGDCRLRQSIAMLMTVGSVVFRPEDGVVWVGTGDAPTSHGTFVPFSLEREDHAPEHGNLVTEPPSEEAGRAFDHYRRAYLAFTDHGDVAEARVQLSSACALQQEEPLYHMAAGLMALVDLDAESALAFFGRALELGHPDVERVSAFHLWRGRAADLCGEREAARRDYHAALARPADPTVHAAASRGLDRPYSRRRARAINVDLTFADVMSP